MRIWKRGQRNLDDWFLCSELVHLFRMKVCGAGQNAGAGSILIGRDIYCRPVGEWDDRLVSGTFYVEKE